MAQQESYISEIAYPKFKRNAAPASAEYEIARETIKSIRRFFAQPGIQERFEAWLEKHGKSAVAEADEWR